jgi:hypothetical protein
MGFRVADFVILVGGYSAHSLEICMSETFFNWESSIGTGTDPTSWINRRMKDIGTQWDAAREVSRNLRHDFRKRFEIYDHHITEANKIRSVREGRALEFSAGADALKQRIKRARTEVLGEIQKERSVIDAGYHAETSHLRFWNVIKLGKAKLRHLGRVGAHKASLAIHPMHVRTLRKKNMYRAGLRVAAHEFRASEDLLRQAQNAYSREAWIGPFRSMNKRSSSGTDGPKPT